MFGNIKIDKCLRRKMPNSGQMHEDGSDLYHFLNMCMMVMSTKSLIAEQKKVHDRLSICDISFRTWDF